MEEDLRSLYQRGAELQRRKRAEYREANTRGTWGSEYGLMMSQWRIDTRAWAEAVEAALDASGRARFRSVGPPAPQKQGRLVNEDIYLIEDEILTMQLNVLCDLANNHDNP